MRDWLTKYWLGAAFGALTGALGAVFARLRLRLNRKAAMEEGVRALLHDGIYSTYAECREKGFADVNDLKNLEYLYRPYHALGGNSTGTELFERVKEMPVSPAEKDG